MIKIIKPGKTIHKGECPSCGCIFEYEKDDLYDITETLSPKSPEPVYIWAIVCPCCKTIFNLPGIHDVDER